MGLFKYKNKPMQQKIVSKKLIVEKTTIKIVQTKYIFKLYLFNFNNKIKLINNVMLQIRDIKKLEKLKKT